MAAYVNKSMGVVNAGGQFAAPGHTLNVSDKTPGIERLVRKGVLAKPEVEKPAVEQRTKAYKKAE